MLGVLCASLEQLFPEEIPSIPIHCFTRLDQLFTSSFINIGIGNVLEPLNIFTLTLINQLTKKYLEAKGEDIFDCNSSHACVDQPQHSTCNVVMVLFCAKVNTDRRGIDN